MLAVLVDAENVPARHHAEILAHAARLGPVGIFRVFGDFSAGRCGSWLTLSQSEAIEPVLQMNGGRNATDIAMTIAAMDLLHSGRLGTLCLVSSDSDFRPLVLRLRAAGIEVHGIGNGGKGLRAACTSYALLEPAPRSPATAPAAPKPKAEQAVKPAVKAATTPAPRTAPSAAEIQVLRTLIGRLAETEPVRLATLAQTLHKEHKPLAVRIGGKGFKTRLAALGIARLSRANGIDFVASSASVNGAARG
ncbi:NYN domain-containing protein [Arsenicitalea aurantiaca]|uniref:NYN domain-containing protein n=1 Tax=Arsenicitalea aurantiaca TaxID=1783274 RepID=A0A433X7R0_9HYPH|nr:NYN domain-containing protein [Arsenicitalea aurantiaca]RUT30127.1 NYN domain-containing protein [Arsenicitalea aurantiaca]